MTFENFFSLDFFNTFIKEYRIALGIIAACVLIGGGSLFYLQLSSIARNESAQMALSETLDEVNNAYYNVELWQEVEIAAKTGFRQYERSDLAPYFLTAQVDALLQQGKHEQALESMQKVLSMLAEHSPFYHIFKIKYARMKLDSSDVAINQSGMQDLIELSQDVANKNYDQALYYLGQYYHQKGLADKAISSWQAIVERDKKDNNGVASPWLALAEKSLQDVL